MAEENIGAYKIGDIIELTMERCVLRGVVDTIKEGEVVVKLFENQSIIIPKKEMKE